MTRRQRHAALVLSLLLLCALLLVRHLATLGGSDIVAPAELPQGARWQQRQRDDNNGDGDGRGLRDATDEASAAGGAATVVPSGRPQLRLPFPLAEPEMAQPPELTAGAVDARDWLVVGGIPTVDRAVGQLRRERQRASWLTYRGAANSAADGAANGTAHGGSQSMLLVRYLVARHPSHGYAFSADLRAECGAHRDIITFELREGRATTGKESGGAGYWGLEAELGMSRKAFAWLAAAPQLYPRARFFLKADDDVFLRVPLYLAELTDLSSDLSSDSSSSSSSSSSPTGGAPLYWGKAMQWGARKGDPRSKFLFVGGMAITLARELAERISRERRFALLTAPFDESQKALYKKFNMDHEDVMIGRALFDTRTITRVVADCRFHDVHKGANVRPVTAQSVAVHHLRLDEYDAMMRRFPQPLAAEERAELERRRQQRKFTPRDSPVAGGELVVICP